MRTASQMMGTTNAAHTGAALRNDFSCVSQVNIHAGQTGALSMVLAENERTSRQQQ